MQTAGIVTGHHFGFFFALVLIPAGFLYSTNVLVAGPIALAIALVVVTALIDHERSSRLELYIDSASWLIADLQTCLESDRSSGRNARSDASDNSLHLKYMKSVKRIIICHYNTAFAARPSFRIRANLARGFGQTCRQIIDL
ncbi:MAG TPA: hypothetical protein VMM15_38215 [Bradyrhizobium sp.]|nr:hypothetical protein [Bradyrhizobium sp.]